jgi:hypothetical protein
MTPHSNPVLAQKASADLAFEFLIIFFDWIFHTIRQSEPPEILASPAWDITEAENTTIPDITKETAHILANRATCLSNELFTVV